jgi:serine protease Do
MSKKKIFFIIIISALGAWLFSIFPGRYLEARISTWPFLMKLNILNPQAPIVITNRETIRISDSGDAIKAVSDVRSKLSLVVLTTGNNQTVVGSAVNLTSDGSFISSAEIFQEKTLANYSVILNDGQFAKITEKTVDIATGLAFFKADLKNVPVVSLGSSKDLAVGEKLIFVQSSLTPFSVKSMLGFVSTAEKDYIGKEFSTDFPGQCFSAVLPNGLISGTAVLNTASELVGIYNGKEIICASNLKLAENLYFKNNKNIVRPGFGFTYVTLSKSQTELQNISNGILVKSVVLGSPAQKASLIAGDVIINFDGHDFNSSNLEEILQAYVPADIITMEVFRQGKKISLKLTVGELK